MFLWTDMVKTKKSVTDSNSDQNELIKILHETRHQIELQKAELQEKQIELEESLDKYADLYDFAPNGYLTLNEYGKVVDINQTGADLLGVNKSNIYNIPFVYYLDLQQISKFMGILRKIRQQNIQISEDFTILHYNKNPIFAHIVLAPVHDYKTRKLNFRVAITDITEKKKIEDALKESEERFRTMAESAPVMIWMSDEENNLLYANSTKLRFLGKTFEEIKDQKWLDLIHPDDRENYIKIVAKAIKERKNFSIEMRVKNRDDEYRWVIRNGAPNLFTDGKSYGLIGSEIDITDRKNADLLTQKSLKEKEILLKEIHHRVKNNLQIISSLLNLQLSYVENDEISGILKSSQSRIRSMAIIHEKLYKSKDLSTINFSDYVKELVSSLFKTYKNKSTNIRLDMRLSDVYLDVNLSVSLGLILNELVTNSIKHAFPEKKSGMLIISLTEKNNLLELTVSDNGVGLPTDFNIKKTNSLGLELVDTLISQHNGELEINRNGKTEFKIHLQKNFS